MPGKEKKQWTMKRFVFFLIASVGILLSCSHNLKKYESNWIVTKYRVDGKDAMVDIMMYNFEIDVGLLTGLPPFLDGATFEERQKVDCKLRFFRKDGKDFMEVSEHYFFSGVYEIRCHDKNCCVISIENKRICMEMDYNGRLPFGKGRNCPGPRYDLINGFQEIRM